MEALSYTPGSFCFAGDFRDRAFGEIVAFAFVIMIFGLNTQLVILPH